MRSLSSSETATSRTMFSPQPIVVEEISPWHSPMPYLFGGLAAMLGLIAFALLILACSYWKLIHRDIRNNEIRRERDIETATIGNGKLDDESRGKEAHVSEELFLVIMAGDLKPTCLATPNSSVSNFSTKKNENKEHVSEEDISDNPKEETSDYDHTLTNESPSEP